MPTVPTLPPPQQQLQETEPKQTTPSGMLTQHTAHGRCTNNMYGLHGSPAGPEVQASSTSLCCPSSPGSLVAWTRKDDIAIYGEPPRQHDRRVPLSRRFKGKG